MNYMKIERFSTSNGLGLRNILWTSGCRFYCKGCHNQEAWDINAGKRFTEESYLELVQDFNGVVGKYLNGISLLGGEPLLEESRETILEIVKRFKKGFPEKDIWLWSGYLYEDIKNLEILNYIDILVDGKFEIDKMDLRLPYAGSTNQRVIDIKKSKEQNSIVLWK